MSVIVHSKDTAGAPPRRAVRNAIRSLARSRLRQRSTWNAIAPSDHSGVGARQATGWRARESLQLRQTSVFAASDRRIRKGVAAGFSPVLAM